MPLFDPTALFTNVHAEEPDALYTLRNLLATCTALQELFEVGTTAAAKELIFPGPIEPPADGQAFTIDELESRIAYAQLYAPDEESLRIDRSKAVGAVCEKTGVFRLHMRRQIREAEYNAADGRWDVYFYFLDKTTKTIEQVVEAADYNLRAWQALRVRGPLFNHRDDWPSQGRVIFVDWDIRWGGSEHAE